MWPFRSRKKTEKEKPIIGELPKPKRRLQYKDKVNVIDGFYSGVTGTIVEWKMIEGREPVPHDTTGLFYQTTNVHWYKVHLDEDNREVWIEKPCLILAEGQTL